MFSLPRLSLRACLAIAAGALLQLTTPAFAAPADELAQLVATALRDNPELRAARKEREAASHRIAPAGALDDPMLEMGLLNVPTQNFSLNQEDMTMKMIGIAQRIPAAGKRSLRQDVATREAEAATHAYTESANRVVRDVKNAYTDLAFAAAMQDLVEKNRRLLHELMKVSGNRYRVGQGNQMEVLKAQTQFSKMHEELLRLTRERAAAEAELNRLLGRPADTPLNVQGWFAATPTALDFNALRDRALSQRPQLLALQTTIAKNEQALALARRESSPDFDVRLSYGQRENMPNGMYRSDMVSLTVGINLPVWRASKTQPRISEAEAMREQAESMLAAQRNETVMRLRQQVSAAEQNLRSLQLYENEILPQARLAHEAAMAGYTANRVELMTVLDNQMTIYNFESAHHNAIAGYNKALAEIEWLAGNSQAAAGVQQ